MIKLSTKKTISNYGKPYVIAELGSNHNGDMEIAKKLIYAAKEAGADCVKFQSWSKSTLFSKVKYEENYFLQDDYRNRTDYTLEEIVDAYAISEDQLIKMKVYCDELNIDCTSTPFSNREVDFLVEELNTPFIKIASMDVNNYPFIQYIASKNRPIILSTGLSTLSEIDEAIRIIENAGNNQIVILHCVAIYPPNDQQINLKRIDTLQTAYPEYPVGFSDHSLGTCIPCAAVARGACLIEKHFTLKNEMEGWDHKISANPDQLKELVQNAKRVQLAIGSSRIKQVENQQRLNEFRRSIVAAKDISKGEIFTEEMLLFKRPGTGLPPGDAKYIIGKKAKTSIQQDVLIKKDDF